MNGNELFPSFNPPKSSNVSAVLRRAGKYVFSLALLLAAGSFQVSADQPAPEAGLKKDSKAAKLSVKKKGPDQQKTQPLAAVTVIGSRLPSFKVPFSDVPSNVSYIPANVSQKNSQQIYETQPSTFQDSVKDLEGTVFYDEVGNGVDTTFSMRGFNQGSSVVTLVDGVRVNEVDGDSVNYPLLPMNDLEAIQVDRGSASPIFGNNAFAGVVHLMTRKPSEKPWSLFGGTEWSSFKGIRFNQGVSGSLSDRITRLGGKFTYYFNGGRTLNDGFRDNGDWRITSFNMKAAYELPDDQGRIRVGIKHVEDAVSNPGTLTFDQWKANPEQTIKPLDGRKMKNTIFQMEADKKFWDDRLMLSLMSDWRLNFVRFFTTSATFPDGAFNPDTDLVTTKSRATDLIWQLAYQDDWKWIGNQSILGMEMRDASDLGTQQDAFQGHVVETVPRETERSAVPRSAGLYWRETFRLFDKVIPHVGMRHDFHWLRTDDHLTPSDDVSRHWHKSTISAGVTYKPLKFADLFTNFSQGYRVPTISEIAPFSGTISSNLQPEQSDSYEVGTRLRYHDRASFKFSYFLIDMKDEIVFDSTTVSANAPFGQNINAGKSRRTGIETRLNLKPFRELNLYGSYTWMHAYIREINPAGTLVDGRSLGLIPEDRYTFGGSLTPLARLGEPYDGLRLGLQGTYTGRQHPQNFESTSQAVLNATGGAGHFIKAYSVWDFILSYEWRGYQVYFKINNLLDEKYYSRSVSATSFGTAIQPAGTFNFVIPGAPREYVLGAKWEF